MNLCQRIGAGAMAAVLAGAALGCQRQATFTGAGGRHPWTVPHVLRLADIADPDNLNEYLSTMDLVYFLSSMIYSYLIVANDRGELIGDLATEVPTLRNGGISPDGTTYTYHLRHGVRWHDGAPLTSADVKFSWLQVVNPNNNTLHREGYTQIRTIDTPDSYTVVVRLYHRYPPFVSKFFTPLQEGGKPVLPEHVLKGASFNQGRFNSAPIGSGPFRFLRWERGRELVLERNRLYYRGLPRLTRIELHIIPNDQTILNEVRLHHVDLVGSPAATQYEQYRSLSNVVTQLYPWNAQLLMIINNSKPGLKDVRVRRAITQSIDYHAIIAKLAHNTGEPAHDLIPPTAIGYTKNIEYRYDPAAANRLLDSAGYRRGPDGVRARGAVRLDYTIDSIAGSVGLRMLAVQLQQYLAAVGIRVGVKEYAYNDIFTPEGPIYRNQYDFAIYGVTLTWDPDLSFYIGCASFYPRGENVYRYCNRRVDTYEAAGLASDDPAVRASAYRHAEPLLWQSVPYVPVYQRSRIVVRSPDLQNFKVNPSSTPWYNIWQWDI